MPSSVKRASIGSTYTSQKKFERQRTVSVSSENQESETEDRRARSKKTKSDKRNSTHHGHDDDEEDDDDEEEEEVYEITSIKKHRYNKDNEIEYLVGWKGYDSDADSWEPVAHLTGAKELLKQYKVERGLLSKPKSARSSNASHKSASKKPSNRATDDSDSGGSVEHVSESKKRKRVHKESTRSSIASLRKNGTHGPTKADRESAKNRNKAESTHSDSDAESVSDGEWHARHLSRSSWEDLVHSIRTIDRESGDEQSGDASKAIIKICLLWHSGRTSWVPNEVARKKLPQKLLDFYENHLQFSPAE